MTRAAVLGEALVDLLPRDDGALDPHPGGSPANTAVALRRLGLDVDFLGGVSTDRWGRQLAEHLEAEGVVLPTARRDEPTALAIASLADDGSAVYRFLWEATADRSVTADDLPTDLGDVDVVVVGSVDAVLRPVADAVLDLVRREHEKRVVVLDPNLRPTIVDDLDAARARLLELASYAHVVKASDEDLELLLPDLDPDEAAFQLLDGEATQLVVVTRGDLGALVTTPRFQLPVPADPAGRVVDTVAAGDTFTAGLVTALAERDLLDRHALRRLDSDDAAAVGRFAAAAAGIVVTRAGADPPRRDELS